MKKVFFSSLLFIQILFAQTKEDAILFSLDNKPVYLSEFERVYTKNNINNQANYSQASLEEYLNLFINFKLKVKEAEVLQMDTITSIKNELNTYKTQLIKTYSSNKVVNEGLLKEAYDRSLYEVDASHILIRWPNEFPSANDSAAVLKTILQIKKNLTAKNFSEVAAKSSQDPSAKDNLGRLGYLTVFQTVYPFENAIYTTKVGQISEPVASQFGYHLVLVHDVRPARGKIKTAHLLIKSKETDSPEKKLEAKNKAFQIYEDLQNSKSSFTDAVRLYSDDTKTKQQGGVLPELSSAEMLPSFADAAFSLNKDGDFSAPVLTSIGWHIIQRISKTEIKSFDLSQNDLKTKVERDSRSNVAQEKNIEDTKNVFSYKFNASAFKELTVALEKSYDNGKFLLDEKAYNKELFSIGIDKYTQNDFIAYLNKTSQNLKSSDNLNGRIKLAYDKFEDDKIKIYRENHLAEINEDYKNLLQEYHDGILLFELTDKEVWSKAVMDTTGLALFHEQNKMNYMWPERAIYSKYTFSDEKTETKALTLLNKGKSSTEVLDKLNKKANVVQHQTYKVENSNLPEFLKWEKGSNMNISNDGALHYYVVESFIQPEPKKLNETRGYVISDYQNYLEKQWIDKLKAKYPVELNKSLFESLIK
jgi:peptidyl-prolyl cis-trans isomerase SurA